MAESPEENPETPFVSFSNPNYRLEDRLNSSMDKNCPSEENLCDFDTSGYMEQSYSQLDQKRASSGLEKRHLLNAINHCSLQSEDVSSDEDTDTRFMDAESEIPCLDQQRKIVNCDHGDDDSPYSEAPAKPQGFLGYYTLLEAKAREYERSMNNYDDTTEDVVTPSVPQASGSEKYREHSTDINSPDSNDSGIQSDDGVMHIHGGINDHIYIVTGKSIKNTSTQQDVLSVPKSPVQKDILPPGWEKCDDEDGAYYWHIKSGTIQREPPLPAPTASSQISRSLSVNSNTSTGSSSSDVCSVLSTPGSIVINTEEHLHEFEDHALQYAVKSLQSLSTSVAEESGERAIRYAVRSLGWVDIAEDDLTPDRSSKAVNKCIMDLSLGRNDLNDAVGRWGDGKDLYMDLDMHSLRLIDTQGAILNEQAIHSIRVWGVGRDNGRDFAYVARDKATRKHKCHVFRCDTPARQIANTLRDICKKIMLERSLQQDSAKGRLTRPTDLPNLEKITGEPNCQEITFQNLFNGARFPTPMEEPKKVIRCHYLGVEPVQRPPGMDVMNAAIERVYNRVPPEKWIFVSVGVAPSTISIVEHGNPDNKIDECRVRYLVFMGIAMHNVRLCAFIMHGAEDAFYAHVFHCEPSGGPLCKTIEAACKLRYQKCLDAHPQTPTSRQQNKSFSTSLKQGMQSVIEKAKTQLKSPIRGLSFSEECASFK